MVRAADGTGGIRPTAAPSAPATPATPDSILSDGVAATEAAVSAPAPATDTRSQLPETVSVKKGDSLGAIAARYQVSLSQLKELNPELFRDGPDSAGKKRGVDGRLIYPGDSVRLRAAEVQTPDPVRATTVSNKVVQAAKDYIDHAAIVAPDAAGGKGQEVSLKVVNGSRKMLSLIPQSDPEHATYENKVSQIFAAYLQQYPDPATDPNLRFQDASKAFNKAARAYEKAGNLYAQMPREDVVPYQQDTMQRAIDAFTQAASAVGAMPAGSDHDLATSQLDMMAFTLEQMGIPQDTLAQARSQHVQLPDSLMPAAAASTPLAGGGADSTQQPIGALPDLSAAGTSPQAIPPAAQPEPYAPAVQPMPGQGTPTPLGTIGQPTAPAAYPAGYPAPMQPAMPPQDDGTIPMYVAKEIPLYTSHYKRTSPNETGTPARPNGTNGTNGTPDGQIPLNKPGQTPGTGKQAKDPNDPKVQQLWNFLKTANHKQVDDLVNNNFDMMYASLPEQKALMMKILLEGRTNGDDQAAIDRIAEYARQQGENDAMIKELDRLYGGTGKGVMRLLEDLTRSARNQLLESLFGDPPSGTQFDPALYTDLVSQMDKKDIEHLAQVGGTTPGSKWLDRIPPQAKLEMAKKVKSWLPFTHSELEKTLTASATSGSSLGAPAGS